MPRPTGSSTFTRRTASSDLLFLSQRAGRSAASVLGFVFQFHLLIMFTRHIHLVRSGTTSVRGMATSTTGHSYKAATVVGAAITAAACAAYLAPAASMDAAPDAVPEASPDSELPKSYDTTGLHVDTKGRPGLYLWGTNTHDVVDPSLADSDPAVALVTGNANGATAPTPLVKYPRRLRVLDDVKFRDVVIGANSIAAIDADGNVLQWGIGHSDSKGDAPKKSIVDADAVKVGLANDKLLVLTRSGALHVLPLSARDQAAHIAAAPTGGRRWYWPFGTTGAGIAAFPALAIPGESIADMAVAPDHVVAIGSRTGQVYSAAFSAQGAASGALGRGLSDAESQAVSAGSPPVDERAASLPAWAQPVTPIPIKNMPVATIELRQVQGLAAPVARVAAGRGHSLALLTDGRAFSWGSNSHGQLGLGDWSRSNQVVSTPTEIRLPNRRGPVTQIAACGDATLLATTTTTNTATTTAAAAANTNSTVTTHEVWAMGNGLPGTLGNGLFTHVQPSPVRVRNVSGMVEYSEAARAVVGGAPRSMVLAPTHAACILGMAPATVYTWGSGAEYATGNGRRGYVAVPTPATPLPWRFGFRAASKGVAGPENGDGVAQMVVDGDVQLVVGPGVSGLYWRAN
ncbi:regulator of chromosome condensation 1/beta-lactamase-inhibitor protein II [Blastocladiella britannica]|nr:regulator of chromosome condensation 1/beta-lactamase-inhibitor protein II [Blastocladiella britannica]